MISEIYRDCNKCSQNLSQGNNKFLYHMSLHDQLAFVQKALDEPLELWHEQLSHVIYPQSGHSWSTSSQSSLNFPLQPVQWVVGGASFFLFFFLLLLHFVKHFVDFAFLFVCRPSFFLASAAAVDYYGRECQRGRVLAEGYQYVAILQPEHRWFASFMQYSL